MAKYAAKGKKLYRLSGSGYVLVPGLHEIPFSLGTYDEVDATDHDNAATSERVTLPTWKANNQSACVGRWDPNNAQHIAIEAAHGGAEAGYKIQYPSSPAKAYTFLAKVTQFTPQGELDDPLNFAFTLSSIRSVTAATPEA